jgi:hypothetical protein
MFRGDDAAAERWYQESLQLAYQINDQIWFVWLDRGGIRLTPPR